MRQYRVVKLLKSEVAKSIPYILFKKCSNKQSRNFKLKLKLKLSSLQHFHNSQLYNNKHSRG